MPDDKSLDRAIEALRQAPTVREAWRAELVERLAHERAGSAGADAARRPSWPPHRWSIRPVHAIAAALGFLALGAIGTAALMRPGTSMSPIATGQGGDSGTRLVTVRFLLVAPSARQVALVGDFNGWDPVRTPMRRSSGTADRWIVEVPLERGRHAYAFYVDGDVLADPTAPRAREEDFGVPNSLVLVGGAP